MSKYFRLGQLVKVSEENDNEGYNDFKGKKLKIVHVARNTEDHPGYDDSMEGMPLYDLLDVVTGNTVNCSLYAYELEKWN